jgi:hypothetical protein
MVQVNVRQFCLQKINSFSEIQHHVLQESPQLVRMVNKDL